MSDSDSDPDLPNLGAQAAAAPTTTTKKKAKKVASEEKDPMEQYRVRIGGVCAYMHACVRRVSVCASCIRVCVRAQALAWMGDSDEE